MMDSYQLRPILHKAKHKTTAWCYQVLIICILLIALMFIYSYHLVMATSNLRTELIAANVTSWEFANALKEHKRIMELRSFDREPKLSAGFVKKVQQFKQTASQDLLEQLYQVTKPGQKNAFPLKTLNLGREN